MIFQNTPKGFLLTIGIAAMLIGACGDEAPLQTGVDGGSIPDAGIDGSVAVDASTGSTAIRQVLVTEREVVDGVARILEGQLAFGQHDAEFFADDDGVVDQAITLGAQEIRVIFDELLRLNRLMEWACVDGSYSRLPDDTTNSDVVNCIGSLPLPNCTKVCIDPNTNMPIGVLDADGNNIVDEARMIDYDPDPTTTELGVSVICDGTSIPLDRHFTYLKTSGSQTFPSGDIGFRGLGPTLVLKPVGQIGLRSGATCGIEFRDEVINFDGDRVCAPTNGIPSEDCTPGDTSLISFETEPLVATYSAPADGATNVALSASYFILVAFTGNVGASTVDITLRAGGVPVAIDPQVGPDDATAVTIILDQAFLPGTQYELIVGPGTKDALGGSVVERTITWTTAAL